MEYLISHCGTYPHIVVHKYKSKNRVRLVSFHLIVTLLSVISNQIEITQYTKIIYFLYYNNTLL